MTVDRYRSTIVTGVVVMIVIAAVIIIPFEGLEALEHHPSSSLPHSIHLGMISNSQVNNSSGQQLNERPAGNSSFSGQSSLRPNGEDVAYFYNSVGTSHILIGSFEFSSQSSASSFVLQIYQKTIFDMSGYYQGSGLSLSVTNGSYDNFHFSAIVLGTFGNYSGSGSIFLIVVGSAGQFAFAIEAYHIAIDKPIALIHDEISAMTS